jgi:hypothetical protein
MSEENVDCPNFATIQEAWEQRRWPSDELIAHIATCPKCQQGLAGMAQEGNIRPEEILALRLHGDPTAIPEPVPDLERLVAYAGVYHQQGEAAAQQRWPANAAHLRDCMFCAANLQEELAFLAHIEPIPPGVQTTLASAPAVLPRVPPTPRPRVVRLPEQAMIRQGAYLIAANARASGQGYAAMRDRAVDAAAKAAIPYVNDLGHDPGATQWVRLTLTYTARYPEGVRCVMQANYVTADGAEKPAVGLAWKVMAPDAAPDAPPMKQGAFDDAGRDAWFSTTDGTHLLIVEYDDTQWRIPIAMQEDPLAAMRQNRRPSPAPYALMEVWVHGIKKNVHQFTFTIPPYQPGMQGSIFEQKTISSSDRDDLFNRIFDAVTAHIPPGTTTTERAKLGIHQITDLGDKLGMLIPEKVMEFLFSDTSPLLISTNYPIFPWELIKHGDRYLGMVRPVSRMPCNITADTAPWPSDRRMLLVVNPKGDLPKSIEEAHTIRRAMDAYDRQYAVTQVESEQATVQRMLQELGSNYEIMHVAGHVGFEMKLHDATALPCAGGGQLLAEDISKARGHLGMVFINGCQGARVENISTDSLIHAAPRVQGLAQAFLARGAVAFISTLWPVLDDSAARFAAAFYEAITTGRRSFGEALRQVREAWYTQYKDDRTWAGYVMYGRPDMTLELLHADAGEATVQPAMGAFSVRIAPPGSAPNPRDVRGAAPDDEADANDSSPMFRASTDPASQFFFRYVAADDHTLDPVAKAAVAQTLEWLTSRSRSAMYQGDLLLGLARVPDGRLARALAAQHIQPDYLAEINTLVLHREEHHRSYPQPSEGVKRVFLTCVERAGSGRSVITEQDLAYALLQIPLSTTVRRMLHLARVDVEALRAALEGIAIPITQGDQPPSPRPFIPGADLIHAPDKDTVEDLPNLLTEAQQHGDQFAPFVAREDELRNVLQSLANVRAPHTLIRGPLGVGKTALIRELAKRMASRQDEAGMAAFAGWHIYQVFRPREAPPMGDYLAGRLAHLYTDRQPAIIVLDDLAHLAEDQTLVATLLRFSVVRPPTSTPAPGDPPPLHYLATATEAEALKLRQQYPDLMRLFTVVEMEPPGAAAMRRILRDYADYLGRNEHIGIQQQAQQVAIAEPLANAALPGAAIARMTEAFAMVVVQRPVPATNDELRMVTPADMQKVIARSGGRS